MGIPNIGAGQIAIQFGMTGPNFTTVSACATGGHALGEASEIIRRDDADVMVAGGAEAGIYEAMVGGFAAMRALSTRNDDPEAASRPFDTARDGFVMGEGAGVVVLEGLDHAEARGATILGELVGYGATADASHITLPAPGGIGAVRAARRALDKAGLTPDDIDHVNAHATSTPEGDKAELQAIRTIFGDGAGRISITANKSMIGHTLGAAGAIEAIVSILTIRDGCVPPTINLAEPDPEAAGMDLTPNVAAAAPGPGRPQQLVRVRRPEHGAHLHGPRPMTDDLPAADRPRAARWRRHRAARPDRSAGRAAGAVRPQRARGRIGRDRARPAQAARASRPPARPPRRPLPTAVADGTGVAGEPSAAGRDPAATARPSIKAPLTGIFYASPAPGTAPYVQVGGEVAVGQVIGLIEAMKLFNEIKSDLAGRVVRVVPESGALVKAKQPLIEVDPL